MSLSCFELIKSSPEKKTLERAFLEECLSNLAEDFLRERKGQLMTEFINSATGLRRFKKAAEDFKKQNKYLNQTETAMFNILEDARELEGVIKEEKDRAGAILSSMAEGLLVVDKNYKIILMNPAAERFLRFSFREAEGKNIKEALRIFKGKEEMSDDSHPVFKIFKSGGSVIFELEENIYLETASAKAFPAVMAGAPLRGNGITGAVIVFRDASEEKKLEESRNSFISTASHQLRTPLTSISWYAEMLKAGDAGELNETQKDFLNEIYSGAARLNETLNMLLMLARLEGSRQKISPEKINVRVFAEEILKNFEPEIAKKNLAITLKSAQEPNVFLDKTILSQVIMNLLSNAMRYTDDNGKMEISVEESGKELIFSVKDDGIGIPKSQQEKVFSKFFRAENAANKAPDGHGLGLALVKSFVELWKGRIWFESPAVWRDSSGGENYKGTAFYFTMPLIKK